MFSNTLQMINIEQSMSELWQILEFTHQQMHFFILKNTLKFTSKYT